MMYQSYAAVYDGSGQVRFALLMASYIKELLHRHPVTGLRALDLACGTGTLALILASEGWHVWGLDRSAAMLEQAQAKAVNANLPGSLVFVEADMRHVASAIPLASFDLVTCTYDSLNYLLTESDLRACFHSVAAALRPGGLFVGDMNTCHFLEYHWGACEVQEQSDYIQITQSYFDPTTATTTMMLTGLVGDDDQGYTRFEEIHAERAYPPETVALLLEQSALYCESAYNCFTFDPPSATSRRILWLARKLESRRQQAEHSAYFLPQGAG
ncbi:MAG: class I SAM-dependent methyltransferase [Chloroflexales bacterium]|nr:class I SAM-dependent methyltransferase [Chloroflexales bacterium]